MNRFAKADVVVLGRTQPSRGYIVNKLMPCRPPGSRRTRARVLRGAAIRPHPNMSELGSDRRAALLSLMLQAQPLSRTFSGWYYL
jgi:hypothetical protein